VLEDQLSVTGAGMIGENGTDDPTAGNETSGNQTNGNETSGNQTNDGVNNDREVETVEDQEQDTTRVRLFHAVPDVEAVEVVAVEQDTGVFNGDPRDLDEDDIDGNPFQDEQSGEQSKEASISTEGSGVYSGFALGYFDPDQAAEKQQQLLEAGTGQDGTEDSPTAGNGDDTTTGGENGGDDTTTGGENGGDDTTTGGENGGENGGDDTTGSENGGDDSTGGNGDDNTQNGGENGGDDTQNSGDDTQNGGENGGDDTTTGGENGGDDTTTGGENGDDTTTGGENGGDDTMSDDTQTDQDPVSRDLIENVSDAGFEVIAVEDARNGERAEGGTADDDDITLPSDLPEATSD
jgi:hypothetical protein